MKIVHAADLHLDSPLQGLERYEGAPVEEIRGATRRAFENLIALCRDERAALLLLAGDLFDGDWKDFSTGLFFARGMVQLAEAGVKVVLVRGNHDAASGITRTLRLPENVRELSSERPDTFRDEALGVAVHGQGFSRRDVSEDLAAAYPAPLPGLLNIGLLHTALEGRAGHDTYAPTSVDVLASKAYAYWALGHVHAREVVATDPWIVFPGNLQGRHARETGGKGATLISVEDGRVRAVEHRVLDVVRWESLDVDAAGCADVDEVLAATRATLASALETVQEEAAGRRGHPRLLAARVTVRGATDAHAALVAEAERWENEVRALGLELGAGELWIEKVRERTTPPADPAELMARDDPVGGVLRRLAELSGDGSQLSLLGGELDELLRKLPAAVRDGLRLDDPVVLAGLVEDVGRLLPVRLLARQEPG